MLNRIAIVLLWLLLLAISCLPETTFAQGCGPQNPNCIVPTAPLGDSSNRAASTAFVQANAKFTAFIDVAAVSPPISCDGTDQSSNLSTLLAAMQTAGTGGTLVFHACTYRFNSAIVFPNDGGLPPTQANFILQGAAGYVTAQNTPGIGGTTLDIRTSDANGHIQTYGSGSLSIRDMTITDGGASNGNPLLYTTNTALYIEHNAFLGSPGQTGSTANQDAIVLGGNTATVNGTPTGGFQGYGTVIRENFFNRGIRRQAYFRTFTNGVVFENNFSGIGAGNPLKGAITATVSAGGSNYVVGDKITLAGGTFSPPVILTVATLSGSAVATVTIRQNGNYSATPSNPVAQSTTTGIGTGATFTLTYSAAGPAIELDGTAGNNIPANFAVGNNILNNTIEVNAYSYGVSLLFASDTTLTGNSFYDPVGGVYIGGVNVGGDAGATTVLPGLNSLGTYLVGVGATSVAMLSADNTNPTQIPTAINGNLNVTGAVVATGVGQFGTQIQMIQSGGGLGKMAVDGVDLIFGNSGSGSLFFDNSGAGGKMIFRSTGFATIADYGNAAAGKWTFAAPLVANNVQAKTIYSAAGTPVPTCNGAAEGTRVSVSDTTAPTYHSAYTSGGAVHGPLYCDGTNWLND